MKRKNLGDFGACLFIGRRFTPLLVYAGRKATGCKRWGPTSDSFLCPGQLIVAFCMQAIDLARQENATVIVSIFCQSWD